MPGPAWLEIDLDAVVRNARRFQASTRRPIAMLPMVKANAYGLGAIPVAQALEAIAPWGYGVATAEEGADLRRSGIERPILVFSPLRGDAVTACLTHRLTPCLGDPAGLAAWLPTGRPFHLEIDTGLSRSGIRWDDQDTLGAVASLLRATGVAWEGVFTHLQSGAPEPVARQRQRFREVLEQLGAPPVIHVASSASGWDLPADLPDTMVRPGYFLYGGEANGRPGEVVARFCAPVVALRSIARRETVSYDGIWTAPSPTRIATIAAGYADGIPRHLSNRGTVELGGTVCPIVGAVAMDFTMVDVGDQPVTTGEVATIFGGRVTLDAQAAAAGTIGYELLTRLGRRVERRYLHRRG